MHVELTEPLTTMIDEVYQEHGYASRTEFVREGTRLLLRDLHKLDLDKETDYERIKVVEQADGYDEDENTRDGSQDADSGLASFNS